MNKGEEEQKTCDSHFWGDRAETTMNHHSIVLMSEGQPVVVVEEDQPVGQQRSNGGLCSYFLIAAIVFVSVLLFLRFVVAMKTNVPHCANFY